EPGRGAKGGGGHDPRALRPRSADPYSIPSLAAGDGERRLRRLHFHQPAGRRRAVRRARQHAQTRTAGRLPWLLARYAARRARRLLQRHLARQTVLGRRITGVSLPHYWVGMVLVATFAVALNVVAGQGMGPEGFPGTWEHAKHLILPVITLSLIPMGVVSRLVRANVLEIRSMEFVSALAAKGLMGRRVLFHIMKNAAPSVLALMG